MKTLNLPPGQKSMLCAGFPDGGGDACQVETTPQVFKAHQKKNLQDILFFHC